MVPLSEGKPAGRPLVVSESKGSDIHHRVAADSLGGLWFVWQSDRNGQFDVVARCVINGEMGEFQIVSNHPSGDWHPSIAIDQQDDVHIAWDSYVDESFDVLLRSLRGGQWGAIRSVANSDSFEGRAQVAVARDNRVWVAWEEGGTNWGKPYRGIKTEQIRDNLGPLHRFRKLRLAVVHKDGALLTPSEPFPMPSAELARNRANSAPGLGHSGSYYERARITFDEAGKLWIVYRHYYTPWLGVSHRTHVEKGWGLYARYLGEEGWSELYRMRIGQGDGMQRLELAPTSNGIALAWTTGRTHRDRNQRPRGVVVAAIEANGPGVDKANLSSLDRSVASDNSHKATNALSQKILGENGYQLFFGDLHRHTELSLCRVAIDGTIDDAYRYAIEVAGLDFLGITDHSRDLAQGDVSSQLWWRCRKEVLRHDLGEKFIPYFSYERSHNNTADHNVISLRGDMLRPHTYPIPDFWGELDRDSLTIPHQPIRRDTWNYQNDALRPLAEIFQGCRDESIEEDIHQGLSRGYHIGFIASSDHTSTSASYACVWAPSPTRESIFRAMQARRTYGATDKIQLVVRAGKHWMGEIVADNKLPPVTLEARGTAPIASVSLIVDGKTRETLTPNNQHVKLTQELDLTGAHYFYYHLLQTDGNEAWSSPIWLTGSND
jgi:hypothetical protein